MFTGVVYTILVIFIHAWASALLVLTGWAMRSPPNVGRVTGKIPTLLLLCNSNLIHRFYGNEPFILFLWIKTHLLCAINKD